jgi:hypothetical protein
MKFCAATLAALLLVANSASAKEVRRLGKKPDDKAGKKAGKKGAVDPTDTPATSTCNADGTTKFPFYGDDSSQRLLLREGVINELPTKMCGRDGGKNVILVIGDGMGWEMVRAGAIAKQVLDQLEDMGCDTKVGCPDNADAIAYFEKKTLSDYYTSGKTQFATCDSSHHLICLDLTR